MCAESLRLSWRMTTSILRDFTRVILGTGWGGGCLIRGRKMIISLDLELFKERLLAEAHMEIEMSLDGIECA